MKKLQPPRGTYDILPDEMRKYNHIVDIATRIVKGRYGYRKISTPMFEFSDVFKRPLGDSSDIVSKEMYNIEDNNESLTLRPENTASIMRAVISGGLTQNLPLKYFYEGSMFRREKPQKGRKREFQQFGLECLGLKDDTMDADVIASAVRILEKLHIFDNCDLQINTLGDKESRDNYRKALVEYFTEHKAKLSDDSLRRLESNPLRILDSKDENDIEIIKNAPVIKDYLSDESKERFNAVLTHVNDLRIKYTINDRLVRGLDYYCETIFEVVTDAIGSQNAILAGGRYDGLSETLGGPNIPGIGWAMGVDRIALMIDDVEEWELEKFLVLPKQYIDSFRALELAESIRIQGACVDILTEGKLSKRMKKADKMGYEKVIIVEQWEYPLLRNMVTGDQTKLKTPLLLSEMVTDKHK